MLYIRTITLIVALGAMGVVAVLRALFGDYRGNLDGETWVTIALFATVVSLATILAWGVQ